MDPKPTQSSCCETSKPQTSCCPSGTQGKRRVDWLLFGSLALVACGYALAVLFPQNGLPGWLAGFAVSIYTLINTIWWGIALGFVVVGLLSQVPREFVTALLGRGGSLKGLARAVLAGVLLDLCSHGILMVGARLYERGASIGQVTAFLLASPWNSFSLTIILVAMVGLPLTLAFIALSCLVALITGMAFERLVAGGVLPRNPHACDPPQDFHFWRRARTGLVQTNYNRSWLLRVLREGVGGSRMVLRWLLFGVVLASAVRAFIDLDTFQHYFGATLAGLALTLAFATILEVCSEGSTPIAADLVNRAGAPGNAFAFLMAGVATDYTEVMVVRDTTRSWKIALAIPLVSLPQVVTLAWVLNQV